MYLAHFGLHSAPFKLAPDPEYLFLSAKHRLGLNLLRYGLTDAGGGITVITGHVGAGKTTLLRQILREFDAGALRIGLLDNTLNFDEHLIRWVASAFDLPFEGRESIAVFRDFQKFVIGEYAQGRQTLLIFDEAQNLGTGALEEIRLLTNINTDRNQLLKIVLVGQPELLQSLADPKLSQVAQRVSVEYHLEPLTAAETAQYIRHRLHIAGTEQDLFTDDAIARVFALSGGVPRIVNTLCDQALVYAFAMDESTLTEQAVLAAVQGRRILGAVHRSEPVAPA